MMDNEMTTWVFTFCYSCHLRQSACCFRTALRVPSDMSLRLRQNKRLQAKQEVGKKSCMIERGGQRDATKKLLMRRDIPT